MFCIVFLYFGFRYRCVVADTDENSQSWFDYILVIIKYNVTWHCFCCF